MARVTQDRRTKFKKRKNWRIRITKIEDPCVNLEDKYGSANMAGQIDTYMQRIDSHRVGKSAVEICVTGQFEY